MSRHPTSLIVKRRRYFRPPDDQLEELAIIRACILGKTPVTPGVEALCQKHYSRYLAERRAGHRTIIDPSAFTPARP